jgi:tRNA A-37 threonylcarbamoyl transferase component Bud32
MIDQAGQHGKRWVDIRTGELDCIVAREHAPRIESALRAGAPSDWPGFEIVKQSTVRTIAHGGLCDGGGRLDVHVKVFRPSRLADRARELWRGSRAVRELHNLDDARARGLPCIEPIAAGVQVGSAGSRSFLVTRSADAVPLSRGPLPADIAHRAGRLLRAAHDAGLHARDLHAGNLLRQPDGALLLCDLTSARFGLPLEDDERAQALAFFCLDLDGNALDPAAAPLLAGYAAAPRLAARAAALGRRLRAGALDAYGRRALRPCRQTTVLAEPDGARLYLHRPAANAHDAARALAANPPPPTKSGRRGAVWLADGLVLKERTRAAARRLFAAAYQLQFAGVPGPQPVALRLERGRGRAVVRRCPGPDLATEVAERALSAADLQRSARALGNALGRLHSHGLRNRDLKLENLVRDPNTGDVAMVDLDGVRRRAPLERRGRAADLGRLLAAFVHAGSPGGQRVLAAFVRGYNRATRCLLDKMLTRHDRRLIAARASAWASAHRSIPTR